MANPGKIISYTKPDGTEQKGIIYARDQKPAYSDYGRVFIRLIDETGAEKLDNKGKKVIAIKQVTDIKFIGFQD